jgi:hypothetical protein
MDTTSVVLGHPLFITMVGIVFGAIGALLTILFTNTRDHAEFRQAIIDLREMVKALNKTVDDNEERCDSHRQEFNKLKGQHDMVIRAGNIVKNHEG